MKIFLCLTFLFFVLFLGHADACEIELCSKFLILDSANPKLSRIEDGIVKNSTCSVDEQKKVIQFLTQTQGVLNTNLLAKYFNNITFRPAQIEIQKLSQNFGIDYSKTQFFVFLEKVHFHKGSLCIENSDISTVCDNCDHPGKKNVTLSVRGSKMNYTIPVDTLIKSKVRAYTVERSVGPGEMLTASHFKEIDFLTDIPAQTQISIDNIRFYSSTRTLNKGDILKISDITPAMVVKPGKTSRVILKNDNLNMQTEGRALQGAIFGQAVQIQLKHKTINALATDFDEVTVEL